MNRRRRRNNTPGIVLLLVIIAAMLVCVAFCVVKAMEKAEETNKRQEQTTEETSEEETPEETTPEETTAASNGHVVCIDPGHGGYDRGSEALGYEEAVQTYELGLLLREELENRGCTVVMTREDDDTKVTLEERVAIANASDAELVVSLHRNLYEGSEDVKGIEAWISYSSPADAYSLADEILKALEQTNTMNNRGIKTGTASDPNSDYAINRGCNMASVILELGFISNKTDNKYYDEYLEEYAIAIADGIMNHLDTYNGSEQN